MVKDLTRKLTRNIRLITPRYINEKSDWEKAAIFNLYKSSNHSEQGS